MKCHVTLCHLFYLQDMFLFIEQKGPHTEGIFKKCGNGKSCRSLKDKLNSGHQVDWENECALVVATTLKVRISSNICSQFRCLWWFFHQDCLVIYSKDWFFTLCDTVHFAGSYSLGCPCPSGLHVLPFIIKGDLPQSPTYKIPSLILFMKQCQNLSLCCGKPTITLQWISKHKKAIKTSIQFIIPPLISPYQSAL